MKVLWVPDTLAWAIGGLVRAKIKHNPQFDSKIIAIHPREAKTEAEDFAMQVGKFNPDIIVYEYFRSAEQLITAQPQLKNYKSILVHHNQRDKALFHTDWNELGIDIIVTHTNKCREKLNSKGYLNVETINHGIDQNFFTYNDKEPEIPMIGYVGRIVPWKGLKEIAEVAQELGYKVQVMGKMDKPDYWEQIPKEVLNFEYFNCSSEERVEAYRNMTIYIGNSEDNYEEGTLPFLEAMACGVPVVTTLNGVANDIIQDNHNALVVPFKDKETLKIQIKRIMEDIDLRKTLRKNGWNTVKTFTEEKMAWEYAKLFNKLIFDKDALVSIIIPATYDRLEQVKDILISLDNQTYSAIEAVVIWDEVENKYPLESIVTRINVQELHTGKEGYNLAMARNIGAIQSQGEYLLFNDSRMKLDEDAVKLFVYAMSQVEEGRFWFFGDKGADKKSFVENFSFVKRSDFMRFGMMNERIDRYGGMSQEIRTRWILQGGQLSYLPSAKAKQLIKSSMTEQKRKDVIRMKFKLLKMYEGESH